MAHKGLLRQALFTVPSGELGSKVIMWQEAELRLECVVAPDWGSTHAVLLPLKRPWTGDPYTHLLINRLYHIP